MSADILSLQPGAAPARSGSTSGTAAKGGPADGTSSDFAAFQQMLGQIDAGDTRDGVVSTLPAGDPQCAEVLDELESLLAMLPAPPPVFPDTVPGEQSGKAGDRSLGLGRDLDLGLGSGKGMGLGATAAGVLAEAKQLLAALESGHADSSADAPADVSADTAESFALAPPRGEALLVRTGPGNEALLTRTVHQGVGTAAWADEIAARVNVMAEQGRHTASLRLSPEHLGPLEIRIAIRDDQASVWFGAAHADTRDALEAAMPRLREMFAAQGLSLADTGVFHEAPGQSPAPAGRQHPLPDITEDPGPSVAMRIQVPLGLLDTYA
jgi:flagellar hook-length control protein FliK